MCDWDHQPTESSTQDTVRHDEEQETTTLRATAARLEAEIGINTALLHREQQRSQDLGNIRRRVIDAIRDEQIEGDGDDGADFNEDSDNQMGDCDQQTSSSECHHDQNYTLDENSLISKLIASLKRLDVRLEEDSTRLRDTIRDIHRLEDRRRREDLELASTRDMQQVLRAFEQRWERTAIQREAALSEELDHARCELNLLDKEEHDLRQQLHGIQNKYDSLSESMSRLIKLLQGKELLPSGKLVSVTLAIELYTEVKSALDNGTFSSDYFLDFLTRHPEWNMKGVDPVSAPTEEIESELAEPEDTDV